MFPNNTTLAICYIYHTKIVGVTMNNVKIKSKNTESKASFAPPLDPRLHPLYCECYSNFVCNSFMDSSYIRLICDDDAVSMFNC